MIDDVLCDSVPTGAILDQRTANMFFGRMKDRANEFLVLFAVLSASYRAIHLLQ